LRNPTPLEGSPLAGSEGVADPTFIAFYFFCVGMILRRIVTAKAVDFEVVCSSVSAYLLIAITRAVSYNLIYGLRPEPFRVAEGGAEINSTNLSISA
jgi:hypothetical protein